jgi:transaldolase
MRIFLDTANVTQLREGVAMGLVDGCTTNPSLIAKEKRPIRPLLEEICSIVPGDVSLEVVATDFEGMIKEGKELAQIAKNVVVKCPVTKDGLKAIKHLSGEGIRGNHTLCFSATQALLSAKAGAVYISPFLGRLDDIGAVGMDLIRDICLIYRNYGFTTQVLAASIRSPLHVIDAAKAGAHVATMPFPVLEQLMKHPLTDSGLSKFLNDWNKSGAEILSYSRAAESSHRERSSPTGTCYVANASGDWHLTSTAIQKEGRYGCS